MILFITILRIEIDPMVEKLSTLKEARRAGGLLPGPGSLPF
jgi:hypothetical protein